MAEDINKVIIEVLTRWGLDVVNDMKAEIDNVVTHDGGQSSALSGSVNYKVINKGGEISWLLTMNPYWKYVEGGRRAGKKPPPSASIKEWIKQKESLKANIDKILGRVTVSKKKTALSKGTKSMSFDNKLNSLAFMIARSIGKKGIKPKPFFNKVINEARINELNELLAPVLKEYFILEFKELK